MVSTLHEKPNLLSLLEEIEDGASPDILVNHVADIRDRNPEWDGTIIIITRRVKAPPFCVPHDHW